MPNYKISVSKENKSYTIMFKAENEAEARNRVHREWYSILGVQEINDKEFTGNTFIFEAYKNWEVKHWKIAWTDIFKVYVNLVKNLEYDVFAIYPESDQNLPKEKKDAIVSELKEEYELFFSSSKNQEIDKIREKIRKEKWEVLDSKQFFLKKELEETNKIIVFVLMKLSDIIDWKSAVKVSEEQTEKLRNIYNSIIKLKKSTNISKLKEIWEMALQKIWKLELDSVEETKDEKSRELLKETNKLLKDLWAKTQFVEKEKDFSYQAKKFFSWLKESFKKEEKEKKEELEIDKESYSYVKTQLHLSKYEEKLRENTKDILSNLFSLISNVDKRDLLFLKRRIIQQNIFLLKSKLKWKVVKYSFSVKAFWWFVSLFASLVEFLKTNFLIIIFTYLMFFLFFININYHTWAFSNLNFSWIFLFLSLIIGYLFLCLSRKIIFVTINFVLFTFIIILGAVNF